MKKDYIERELKGLGIGKTRVIAWECVTRWSENLFEIGTYGIDYKQMDFDSTVSKLMREVVA